MVRSRVLLPDPEGPTTAVMLPRGTSASMPFRISTPPVAYRTPEILIPRDPMLEHLPAEVGVEPVEDRVGVPGQGRVVRKDELHTADDGVQATGLGTAVLVVHQVRIVHDLRDLRQHGIFQRVLLEKGLEGAIIPAVGEPGARDVEELRTLGRLRRVFEEGEDGLAVYETPDQPHARRAVHVTPAPGGPEHQPPSLAPSRSTALVSPLRTRRAARRASAASVRRGERK